MNLPMGAITKSGKRERKAQEWIRRQGQANISALV